jgi:hypothetical protein
VKLFQQVMLASDQTLTESDLGTATEIIFLKLLVFPRTRFRILANNEAESMLYDL